MAIIHKKLFSFLIALALLIPICSNAWWSNGHLLAATIAADNLTPRTQAAVDKILKPSIEQPGPVICQDRYPGYRLVAVATWADNIKTATWANKETQAFYTAAHFIDSILYCNKPDTATPAEHVEKAIKDSNGDNAASVLHAAIVTLKSTKTSEKEKNLALRYFVHLAGDITQPLHATDPEYFLNPTSDKFIDTKGGGNILFKSPEYISVLFADPSISFFYNDIHSFWNDMGDSSKFPQRPYSPGNIIISKVQQGSLLAQVYGSLIPDVEKYLGGKIEFKRFNDSLDSNPRPFEWAEDSYVQTKNFAIKGLDFSPADDSIYWFCDGKQVIMIPKLPTRYRKKAKEISELQIYKAGIRIANMLNAIYDPGKAPTKYVEFVNSINGKTLDQLRHVVIR